MADFHQRLKGLRTESKKTQKDIAALLSVTRPAIANYEMGLALPTPDKLATLADYFDVSIEYLMGKTDIRSRASDPEKKEVDIRKALQTALHVLQDDGQRIIVDGEELTGEQRELMINSIENSLKLSIMLAERNRKI